MPVPHFNIKITQRSKGNSAVAGAAYQAGEKLFSEYDQKTKNYTCKKEVVYTEIMLPPNAPPEYADRATLWNSVEEIEKQWNSQLARRFVAALPREVPMELLPQMVKEYCEEQFVSKGMCCDFAIHDPDPPGCALPGFVDSKNEEKTERNAGYLVVSHSGGGMLRQGTRKGIRRTPANRGMRAHRIVKSLDISEDVCHGLCP